MRPPGIVPQSSESILSTPTSTQPKTETTPRKRSAAKNHQLGPAFICTICWQPQSHDSKPKLLGTSARIVCKPCWRAVLDLSICWVCGECIVRGDDFVSLGWCFWHRDCFGCLVCGDKLDVPDTQTSIQGDEGETGKWGKSRGAKRGIGVELSEIPLCTGCCDDTVGESQDQVLRKGLERVSKSDGGLHIDRLQALVDETEGEIHLSKRRPAPRKVKSDSGVNQEMKDLGQLLSGSSRSTRPMGFYNEEFSSLLENAAGMGMSEDGATDGHSHSDTEKALFGQDSPDNHSPEVPVVAFDPTKDPDFRTTRAKSLPKWMQFLPSNVQKEREELLMRANSVPIECDHVWDNKGKRRKRKTIEAFMSGALAEHQDEDTPTGSPDVPTPTTPKPTKTLSSTTEESGRQARSTSVSFVEHPEHQGRRDRAKSNPDADAEAVGTTSQGVSSASSSIRKSPYPRTSRTPSLRHEPSSYFSHSVSITSSPSTTELDITSYFAESTNKNDKPGPAKEACCHLGVHPDTANITPNESQRLPNYPVLIYPYAPTPTTNLSSEYLDKYQPVAPESRHHKYVAKDAKPILDKMKRQRGRRDNGKGVSSVVKMPRLERRSKEEWWVDPKKDELQKELKRLFRGE